MSEGYDTSSLFDGIPMTDAVRNDLNHRVRMHVRSLRLEALAISDTNNELAAQLSASQARLSEAVKVLEPFAKLGDVVLAEAPASATNAHLFTDSEGVEHKVSPDNFRAARQFLATIGEESHGG